MCRHLKHLRLVEVRDGLEVRGAVPALAAGADELWVEVVDANRSSIRSGDPDLIFPGEQVTLPAVE